MGISRASRAMYALAALGLLALAVEAACVRRVRRRAPPPPARRPGCSVIKPLSGFDGELERDLESHAAIDYDGEWEVLLGLRDEDDLAAPVARAFAARHPDRVRLVVHEEESGANPRINQLIALTRAARHEVIVCTDANVRVPPSYLREVAAALQRPGVGLVTHLVAGSGERRLGAVVDNQAWLTFVAPNVALAAVLGMEQIVGKSVAVPRDVLERMGGWEAVKDVVGEDKRLGPRLRALGLHSWVCGTPVLNVQVDQGLGAFWSRQTRWAMIRSRLLRPGFFFEPLLNPTLFSVLGLACSPRSRPALGLTAATWAAAMALAQAFALLLRGHAFRPRHVALFPLAQLLLFLAWARGATLRTIDWHGRVFAVDARGGLARLSR